MPRLVSYDLVRDAMAAQRGHDFSVQALQYETGFSRRTVLRALEALQNEGRVRMYEPASGPLYAYCSPHASSGRVPYGAGRCNGCNEYSRDGTVREIRAGQVLVRLCDSCMVDAGLQPRE